MAEKKTSRKKAAPKASPKPQWDKLKLPETGQDTVVFNTDPPIVKNHYEIDYIHSYAEDSPFFIGLSHGKLLGSLFL